MCFASPRVAAARVAELHGRPEDAIRFARAEIADELVNNGPSRIHAGLVLGRCHAKLGQHSLSVSAFEAASRLAEEGRYLLSSVLTARARAVAGKKVSGAAGAAAGGHWSEAEGRQRLAEAVERMAGGVEERGERRGRRSGRRSGRRCCAAAAAPAISNKLLY